MAKSKGSTKNGRQADHPWQAEYGGSKNKSTASILRTNSIQIFGFTTDCALQEPGRFMPKLFGELRERYLSRPGGYTRVLRIEPEKEDQAPSAILQLVDGPRDMRFMMTAKTIVREQKEGLNRTDLTTRNIKKVTTFRPEGLAALDAAVEEIQARTVDVSRRNTGVQKERVYERRKDHQ